MRSANFVCIKPPDHYYYRPVQWFGLGSFEYENRISEMNENVCDGSGAECEKFISKSWRAREMRTDISHLLNWNIFLALYSVWWWPIQRMYIVLVANTFPKHFRHKLFRTNVEAQNMTAIKIEQRNTSHKILCGRFGSFWPISVRARARTKHHNIYCSVSSIFA